MRVNDFSCVGFIENRLEPEAHLIDGREIETVSMESRGLERWVTLQGSFTLF